MSTELSSDAILAEHHPAAPYPENETFISAAFRRFVELLFNLSAMALVVASAVLTGGVIAGHVLGRGLVWQDEMEIFLVAGAVFVSAAAVQARRNALQRALT